MNTAGSPDFDPDADDETYTPLPREAWIAGRAETSPDTVAVTHPADETEVATVALPTAQQAARAVDAAVQLGRIDDEQLRTGALQIAAGELEARADELTELITAESGIPMRWARQEVDEAAAVLRYAADHPLGREGRTSEDGGVTTLIREVPRAPVLGAVSQEAPLRSAAHIVAAAFAVGAPVVVAAGTATPLSALALGEALGEIGMPEGSFSILPGAEPPAPGLVRMDGTAATAQAGAAVVVTDWPNPREAADRIAVAATRQGGLRPEAVRRVVVCSTVADDVLPALASAFEAQHPGNAYDPSVSVGTVPEDVAERTSAWVAEAVAAGAAVSAGGKPGEPALITGTEAEPPRGPVLAASVVDEPEEAIAAVLTAPAAGLFTRDNGLAMRARDALRTSRVVVGDVPDYDPASVRTAMHALTTLHVTTLT